MIWCREFVELQFRFYCLQISFDKDELMVEGLLANVVIGIMSYFDLHLLQQGFPVPIACETGPVVPDIVER